MVTVVCTFSLNVLELYAINCSVIVIILTFHCLNGVVFIIILNRSLNINNYSKAVVLLWFSVACFWCQSFGDVSSYVCSYYF